MEKCVVDLFSAVTMINNHYYSDIGTREDQTQYDQNTENPFTAELYHRYRTIIEQPANQNYYNNLILHFDITKAAVNMRPDLVLHETQRNRNNQKMFVEVKTDPDINLNRDFNKLLVAADQYLNFQSVVIIVANRPFQQTKELVSNYFRTIPFETRQRIFLLNAEIQGNNVIDYNIFPFTSIRY